MPDYDVPNLSASWDATDDERGFILADQASLPSDMVNPADALGDARWQSLVDADILGQGEAPLADFQYSWDWEMTPQQRAAMLADVAFDREMTALIDEASGLAAKPPVDPVEFADAIRERRAGRARRM